MSGLKLGDGSGRVARRGVDVDVGAGIIAGGMIGVRPRPDSGRSALLPLEFHRRTGVLRPNGVTGAGFEVAVVFPAAGGFGVGFGAGNLDWSGGVVRRSSFR